MRFSEGPWKIYKFEGKPGYFIRGKALTDLVIVPDYDVESKGNASLVCNCLVMYEYILKRAKDNDEEAVKIIGEIEK